MAFGCHIRTCDMNCLQAAGGLKCDSDLDCARLLSPDLNRCRSTEPHVACGSICRRTELQVTGSVTIIGNWTDFFKDTVCDE